MTPTILMGLGIALAIITTLGASLVVLLPVMLQYKDKLKDKNKSGS